MAVPTDYPNRIFQLGEQELIRRFFAHRETAQTDTALGIGDDCAVLKSGSDNCQLITTDQLLEGVHFQQSLSSANEIGHKAAAVNFSDIAAMGGRPTSIFLSVGLPSSTLISWVDHFSTGFNELCEKYETPLLGGDTTSSKHDIVINVMVLGTVKEQDIKLCSNARANDWVCTTGTLGNAAAGLKLLQAESKNDLDEKSASYLANCHRQPTPAVKQGQWLGTHPGVHAMIDLSDGIATDGQHIASASDLAMHIDVGNVPLSSPFKKFTADNNQLRKELSLGGGEDYHLLCTCAYDEYDKLNDQFQKRFGTPLYKVGRMKEENTGLQIFENGKEIERSTFGFNHFKTSK